MISEGPLRGEPLLAAVSKEMVSLHEQYHGRVPAKAKTLMMGDNLLACVLGGVYTTIEKTLIELQRTTIVQETRSLFQQAMQGKFIDTVERLSGRRVLAFISNQHVGPDLEIELFVLAPRGDDPRVAAPARSTARGDEAPRAAAGVDRSADG
jgi:uncharacterized protein YbcI